jgi:hypothetical protein
MTEKLTPRAQAEKLFGQLLRGEEVHREFEERMKRTFTIADQTMEYWNDHFRVTIDTDNLTPARCQQIGVTIMRLAQEASYYYSIAQAKASWIKQGSESSFLTRFAAITADYKTKGGRIPGAQTLETLARIETSEIESAQVRADVESKFWKEILGRLETCRKILENATLNISTELKYLANERRLDNLEQRSNGGGNE